MASRPATRARRRSRLTCRGCSKRRGWWRRSSSPRPRSAPATCSSRCSPTKNAARSSARAARNCCSSSQTRCGNSSPRSSRLGGGHWFHARRRDVGGHVRGGSVSGQALDQFTIDLTARAKKGKIDPVLGRDLEIRQIIDILTRRRQNNPILDRRGRRRQDGGRRRLRAADRRRRRARRRCKNVALRTLDLGLLQAGAGVKGEFENRLKAVIERGEGLAHADHPLHRRGAHDDRRRRAGRARATRPTCSSRRWRAASCARSPPPPGPSTRSTSRRTPPSPAASRSSRSRSRPRSQAMLMMRGLAPTLEKHHNVRILDEAVDAAVRLSHRYITGRQLPDKAVSVLDTACARLALGQNADPGAARGLPPRSSTTCERADRACSSASRPSAPTTPSGWRDRERRAATRSSNGSSELEARWDKEHEPGRSRSARFASQLEAVGGRERQRRRRPARRRRRGTRRKPPQRCSKTRPRPLQAELARLERRARAAARARRR